MKEAGHEFLQRWSLRCRRLWPWVRRMDMPESDRSAVFLFHLPCASLILCSGGSAYEGRNTAAVSKALRPLELVPVCVATLKDH